MNESKPAPSGFAALGNRLTAQWIDLALLFFMAIWLAGALESPLQLTQAQVSALQNALLLVLGFIYFAVFPLTRLQGSPGKWLVGIRLRDREGNPPTPRRCVTRAGAMLLWFWALPHLGWLAVSGIEPLGQFYWSYYPVWAYLPHVSTLLLATHRSLFDLVSGTVVATRSAGRLEMPPAGVDRAINPLRIAGVALALFVLYAGFTVPLQVIDDRNLRARMTYAIAQTADLREKAAQFRAREGRWPVAGDTGIPVSTPYPDGGSYRTLRDGRIEIAFAVKPGIKGHTISLRPVWIEGEARAEWKCVPDPGISRRILPPGCRE